MWAQTQKTTRAFVVFQCMVGHCNVTTPSPVPNDTLVRILKTRTHTHTRARDDRARRSHHKVTCYSVYLFCCARNNEVIAAADIATPRHLTEEMSSPRLATSVAMRTLRCPDLNFPSAPNLLGWPICPCRQTAWNPRFRSRRATRCGRP